MRGSFTALYTHFGAVLMSHKAADNIARITMAPTRGAFWGISMRLKDLFAVIGSGPWAVIPQPRLKIECAV